MSDIIMKTECPIVTVSVGTYNSSKFVLETLESIKAQTYPSLILQICDDYSTDNTVELCKKWIKNNKDRFVKTKIIVPEHNTGISSNANRAWDACETEYFKGIAGDDLLMPNCIEDFMTFIKKNPESVIVFSKIEIFGPSKERIDFFKNFFDYSFFELDLNQQYHRLMKDNCIPAGAVFLNINKVRELGIRHDERLPMLEDLPKWVNFIKKRVKFDFIDKVTVRYRVGENGLSSSISGNLLFQKSRRLFEIYYVLPYKLQKDYENAIQEIADYEVHLLDRIEQTRTDEIRRFKNSLSYKLGNFLLTPFSWLKNFFNLRNRLSSK